MNATASEWKQLLAARNAANLQANVVRAGRQVEADMAAARQREQALASAAAGAQLANNAPKEVLLQRRIRIVDTIELTDEQHRAALEINTVWIAITTGLFAKVQQYERHIRGTSHQDWRASTINAYQNRYIPWRNESGVQAVVGQGSLTVGDLVFAVSVDNYGFRQVANRYRMCPKTVKRLVRVSLLRYAEIGGWVDHCGRSKLYA